jgi:hypothetical protein
LKLRRVLLLAALCLLTGCEPPPTPFPVDIPQKPTETPAFAELPPLRYVLMPNMLNAVPDMELIGASAEVIQLSGENPPIPEYDILVTYGTLPDWTRSELTPQITLALNTSIPPLDNEAVMSIIRRALNPQDVIAALNIPGAEAQPLSPERSAVLRTELANMGYPDGIALAVGVVNLPGAAFIMEQLRASNIDAQIMMVTPNEARSAFEAGQIQAALVMWTQEAERAKWGRMIDLFSVPISYRVKEGLQVSFTPSGFPHLNSLRKTP